MSKQVCSFSKKKPTHKQDKEQLYLRIAVVLWYNNLASIRYNVLKMVTAIVIANLRKNGTSILKVIIERSSS